MIKANDFYLLVCNYFYIIYREAKIIEAQRHTFTHRCTEKEGRRRQEEPKGKRDNDIPPASPIPQ